MNDDPVEAIRAMLDESISRNYARKTGKKLGDVLDDLFASEHFAGRIELMINHRVVSKGQSRNEAMDDLWKDQFGLYSTYWKLYTSAMDSNGGKYPHDLAVRNIVIENQIKAGDGNEDAPSLQGGIRTGVRDARRPCVVSLMRPSLIGSLSVAGPRDERFAPSQDLLLFAVTGRFKTSHLWAPQNQPPLAGSYTNRFDNSRWFVWCFMVCFC